MAIVAKNPNWKTDTVKVEIDGKEVEVPRAVAIIRDQWDSLGADGKADGKIDDTEIQNVLSALEINQGALKTALDHFASYKAAKGSERTKVISTAVAKLEGFEKNVTSDLGKESIREIVSMLRSGDDNQIQAAMHYMAKMDYIRTHAEGRVSDTELAEFFTKCKNRV